jgi:predicted Fe-Mo cluster-binding NifX family protein
MKAALTIWDGRVAPVFDVSQKAVILTIENGTILARHTANIEAPTASQKVGRLIELGVGTLICGAISEPLYEELSARNVRILGFVAGPIEEVLQAYVAGELPSPALCMPGCAGRHRRLRGRRSHDTRHRHGLGPRTPPPSKK